MRKAASTTTTAITLAAALATGACGSAAASRDAATPAPPAATTTKLLRFTYQPAAPATSADRVDVAIWFAADARGDLVGMRSARVGHARALLQETAYDREAGKYAIADHVACTLDPDVAPPSETTATGLVSDSIGPLEARRPVTDISDGQLTMRVRQRTADLTTRVVTLIDAASGTTLARLDRISITDADEAAIRMPLMPLTCTPPSAQPRP